MTNLNTPKKRLLEAFRKAFPHASSFHVSRQVRVHGRLISAGDLAFVVVGGMRRLAEVWYHAKIGAEELSCVSVWDCVDGANAHAASAATYRKADSPRLVHVSNLICAATYIKDGMIVTALLPTVRS